MSKKDLEAQSAQQANQNQSNQDTEFATENNYVTAEDFANSSNDTEFASEETNATGVINTGGGLDYSYSKPNSESENDK